MSSYDLKSISEEPVKLPEKKTKKKTRGFFERWFVRFVFLALLISLGINAYFYQRYRDYFSSGSGPIERYYSGPKDAVDKIAIVKVSGTIMPPNTRRILARIKQAKNDDAVKAVLLSINSPGGLVSDSHEIYHRLVELRKTKPVIVHMKSMAASGGLYVAMGAGEAGKVIAEPTTWTGSIGVIIPRMEMVGLADKVGVQSVPLKTGPFKDALSPFRHLGEEEHAVWDDIIQQSFDRFLNVIADNRAELNYVEVKKLATGQVYTAKDALQNKLIDKIGYEEDALEEAMIIADLDKDNIRVVTYESPATLISLLLGTARAADPDEQWQLALESSVPRPMYCCSWLAGISSGRFQSDGR